MSGLVKGIFGGGSNNKAQDEANKQAEQSRQLQTVANDRQLADLNRQDSAVAATRRAPRGRRLFEDGPSNASAVLG